MRCTPLVAFIMLLAACNPAQDAATNETAVQLAPGGEAAGAASASDSPQGTDAGEDAGPSPEELALVNTAWRVSGEDGAIYTTFFDPEGKYRDLKNGEPWHDGTWERVDDGRLCFTPSDEDRTPACWALGKHRKNGTMRVTSEEGREVMLQQITYLAPAE